MSPTTPRPIGLDALAEPVECAICFATEPVPIFSPPRWYTNPQEPGVFYCCANHKDRGYYRWRDKNPQPTGCNCQTICEGCFDPAAAEPPR